jgi:hypothetical protein
MDKPTEIELVDALLGMACQYLEDSKGFLQCDYVSASEQCIDVLTRLELIKDGKIIGDAYNYEWLANYLRGE